MSKDFRSSLSTEDVSHIFFHEYQISMCANMCICLTVNCFIQI